MREQLAILFDVKALEETKAGGGKRVVVRDEAAVREWIASKYPSGLSGTDAALPPRAESVANFADSKRGRSIAERPVFLRGFADAVLHRVSGTMPIGELTHRFGLVAALVDASDPWRLDGTLALVENFELFMHVERVIPAVDAALWYSGRIDQGLLGWIAGMPSVRVIHVGDFDPVGLDEYLRVRTCLGDRATLFVPESLAQLVARYGQAELLSKSVAVLKRVRQVPDEAVQAVVAVLDSCGKGLEQEVLIVGLERS